MQLFQCSRDIKTLYILHDILLLYVCASGLRKYVHLLTYKDTYTTHSSDLIHNAELGCLSDMMSHIQFVTICERHWAGHRLYGLGIVYINVYNILTRKRYSNNFVGKRSLKYTEIKAE